MTTSKDMDIKSLTMVIQLNAAKMAAASTIWKSFVPQALCRGRISGGSVSNILMGACKRFQEIGT